ncbi:MAG: hypothetical protein RI911_603, partial [Candidatus Parcubacteria bacterium]
MSFILAVVALIWVYQLNSRIDMLKKEVDRLKGGRQTTSTTPQTSATPTQNISVTSGSNSYAETQQTQVVSQQPQSIPHIQRPIQQPVQHKDDAFTAWIKEDFFVKLGALLLLIGFGWFVSYAFAHNWIGPMGRIAIGLITGVGIMAFGAWRIRTHAHQGGIFLVLGSTTVLLTVFAAREIYNFFTPTSALILMFLAVVFVAYASVVHKNTKLALASLILASIAPFFTNSPTPDVAGLFTYLLLVVLGTLWVVYLTGAYSLVTAALIITSLYSLPFLGSYLMGGEQDIALLFAFIFTALFFSTNVASIVKRGGQKLSQAHLMTALGTGLYLIVWILAAAPKEWQSLLFVAWMLVFGLGAYVVFL